MHYAYLLPTWWTARIYFVSTLYTVTNESLVAFISTSRPHNMDICGK